MISDYWTWNLEFYVIQEEKQNDPGRHNLRILDSFLSLPHFVFFVIFISVLYNLTISFNQIGFLSWCPFHGCGFSFVHTSFSFKVGLLCGPSYGQGNFSKHPEHIRTIDRSWQIQIFLINDIFLLTNPLHFAQLTDFQCCNSYHTSSHCCF